MFLRGMALVVTASPLASGHSFMSEILACVVKVQGLNGEKEDTVFVCLDNTVTQTLARRELGIAGATFVGLSFPERSAFRLSLTSLERYSAFLALELLPFLRERWGAEGFRTIIVGQQFSGVLGVYTAARFPVRFAGALCLSASFWWKPEHKTDWEWLSKWLAEQTSCPGKVFLICSVKAALDRPRGVPTTLMANKHLKDVLTAKSCQVQLLESSKPEFSTDFLTELIEAVHWFLEKPIR